MGLRIADALALDVIDPDLAASAHPRPVESIGWLCTLAKLDLGAAKGTVTRLGAMGDELFEQGTLSWIIESVRRTDE